MQIDDLFLRLTIFRFNTDGCGDILENTEKVFKNGTDRTEIYNNGIKLGLNEDWLKDQLKLPKYPKYLKYSNMVARPVKKHSQLFQECRHFIDYYENFQPTYNPCGEPQTAVG